MNNRIIAHLDMDAFFAAVDERDNPRWAGLPIAIGADPKNGLGRGVVSTANYKARTYGIHSAQPISVAWRLSGEAVVQGKPAVVFLPPNFSQYREVADHIHAILAKYVTLFEQASIDEFYLDLSFCRDFGNAKEVVTQLKSEIKAQERLTASVGIAPNKLIAKMLSSRFKPDGLALISQNELNTFLDPLPIGDIPGIGPKTEEFLFQKNIRTVVDLKRFSKEELSSWFGKWGSEMYDRIRGVDNSLVVSEREIKSISEEETFETDTLAAAFLLDHLVKRADRVIERMQEEEIPGFRTVGIKIRFSDFMTKTRSHTLQQVEKDAIVLRREVQKLFLPFLDLRENPKRKRIRLIGVKIENFFSPLTTEKEYKPIQPELF